MPQFYFCRAKLELVFKKLFCDIFSFFRNILYSQEAKIHRASMKERRKKGGRKVDRENIQDLEVKLYIHFMQEDKVGPQMSDRRASSAFIDKPFTQ